jgi:hypothetical protein
MSAYSALSALYYASHAAHSLPQMKCEENSNSTWMPGRETTCILTR